MVDPDRLLRILQRLRADVAVLEGYGRDPVGLRGDAAALGHVKYTVITAVEGVINAAQHICAADDLGAPETNADAIRLLVEPGIVDRGLAERLARAVGFRNLLVRGYARVDDDLVVDNLANIDDLYAFADAVTELLRTAGKRPGPAP